MVPMKSLVKRKRSINVRLTAVGLTVALSVLMLLAFLPVSLARIPGTAAAWGRNNEGQCNVPAPNSGFAQVSGGGWHSLGLKADGTVVAWGLNAEGQCNVPAPNSDFVGVSGGGNHSLGLKSDGTVVAWGDNSYDQCDVPTPNSNFAQVSAGGAHSLGLKSDGTVVAWGCDDEGQCNIPAPNSGFAQVAGGGDHSLGLKSDGTVVAWGYNANGQCNVPAPNSGFAQVAGGELHSLGLKSDGTVVAWGANGYGQCNVPAPNSGFAQVSGSNGDHSLGLKSDGTVVAWGLNDEGQCNIPAPNSGFAQVAGGGGHSLAIRSQDHGQAWGDNTYGQLDVPAPNYGFAQVAGGGYHSLGLKSDGTVVAWGRNNHGQCDVPAPNSGFAQVAGGGYHSLGLKSDGTVVAWGWNIEGQCNVPVPNTSFAQVSAGAQHSLGLKSDGTVMAWGCNQHGQCNVPVPNTSFAQMAGGAHHSLGLKADGTVVAWGLNDQGQCNVPAPNSGFAQMAGGAHHSLGLKADGTVVAWGLNNLGQCSVPTPNSNFVKVSAGAFHSLGLKSDGTVVAWGDDDQGQCNIPAPNSNFAQVSAGGWHSLSVKSGYGPSNIAGCEPVSVVQGHTVNVDITGNNTRFKSGESKATFSGTGITVNSTDVTDANHACASITVAAEAPAGHRDLNVVTGSEVPTPLGGVFTVKVAPPKPHLDSLAPKSGTVGTHVMLSGEHFGDAQGQSCVTFNGTKASSYHLWADGIIVCNVPSGATTGPVTVTTPAGTSNGVEFTVTKPHVPKITDVSPNAVHQGDSSVDITINGKYTHFKQGQSVATFSGTGITVNSTTVNDSTHASANITVALDAPTGNRDVNVITGTETPAPLVNHFTVQPHGALPPRLDGISPTEGTVGDKVTLSGGNFGSEKDSSQVTFHEGVAATEYSSWEDGKIVCKVPAGANTGPVTVTTTGGTSGGKTFTVVEPLIKDCDPRVVVQGHKVELDVLGEYTHFANGKSMMVVSGKNGVKVGSTYASDATHASATVTVADDATPGVRDVNVVTGSEHPEPLSNVFTIKKKPDNPPAISALHPASGPVGTRVSVVGTNFGEARGSSTVTFGGIPVTNYVSWSDHDVICNVPLGAETGDVKVHTPWGASGGLHFTVTDFTFYFAEGTCRPGFAPYLTIQNPDPSDAKVKITYMLGDGTTTEQDLTIPATTRSTVTVTDTLGVGDNPAHDFSAKVECTNSQAIIVERPMYFDYGTHQGLSWTGGSDVIGALSPAESFFFAEGTCRPGFQPYLTIQNPDVTDAQVKITYMLGDGTTQEQDLTVPATTRSTVTVTDTLGVGDDPAHDFSCKVECTNSRAIVVERPMYFSYGAPAGLAWTGCSDVVGALSPAEEFYFAEGTTRPGFQPYLTIQNPASTEAQVVITYMRGDGTNQQQALTVPATSRATVTVTDILGSGDSSTYDFSATVASTNNVDIIAERPMYFNYGEPAGLAWTGGSDVVGALSPAGTFYFAEGTCRPNFSPYLTIQNPGLAHAQVKITYMLGDGTTTEQEITVGARSRYTVFVPETLGVGEDAAHDFSATVECTNNKEVIAERPMYFNYNGVWTGGSDVVGFAP